MNCAWCGKKVEAEEGYKINRASGEVICPEHEGEYLNSRGLVNPLSDIHPVEDSEDKEN